MHAVSSARSALLTLALAACATPLPAPVIELATVMAGPDYPATNAVLVAIRDSTVFEGYFGDGGAEAFVNTRSVTKSVTALALGAAIADGHIVSADQPAFPYLASLAPFANDGPAKQAITLADLLTMSSALDCDDGLADSPGNEENMYPREAWVRWAADLPLRTWRRDSTGRGPFAYCTAGVVLLGRIITEAVGEPVDRYIERRLLRPLGIDSVRWTRSPSGEPMTGGGLEMRATDLLALGRLVAAGGVWQGRQVVPAAWIDRLLTRAHRLTEDRGYGGLFWTWDYRTPCGMEPAWMMSGNGGNHVVIWPDLGLVVVVTRTRYNSRGMHEESKQLVEEHVLPAVRAVAGPCGTG